MRSVSVCLSPSLCGSLRLCVCLSVCLSNFTKFALNVTCGYPGNTCVMYFRFVDDVTFSCDSPSGGVTLLQQPHCNIVHGLTPVLHGISCILSLFKGCRGAVCNAPLSICVCIVVNINVFTAVMALMSNTVSYWSIFQVNLAQPAPSLVFSLQFFITDFLELMARGFFRLHVIPVTLSSVSGHWREHNAPNQLPGLILSYPPPDCWLIGHCCLLYQLSSATTITR